MTRNRVIWTRCDPSQCLPRRQPKRLLVDIGRGKLSSLQVRKQKAPAEGGVWKGDGKDGSVSLRYSGNLSAILEVRPANNQAALSKIVEKLTPTGDIVRKWKEDFWGTAKPHKNVLWARDRPARFGGGGEGGVQSLSFKIQKQPTQSTLCGTQIKNPLDVCCSYKDLLMKSHGNYVSRIFTVNKMAGGVKMRGRTWKPATNSCTEAF